MGDMILVYNCGCLEGPEDFETCRKARRLEDRMHDAELEVQSYASNASTLAQYPLTYDEPEYFEGGHSFAKIEHESGLVSSYSGWENRQHPEKEHMAYGLVSGEIPWLLEMVQLLHEENEKYLDRIRGLGYKREEAVKALEWALDEIGETGLEHAEDQKGEWALRVLATLKGGNPA